GRGRGQGTPARPPGPPPPRLHSMPGVFPRWGDLRYGDPPFWTPGRRAATLGHADGPVTAAALAPHELGPGGGLPARWPDRHRRRLPWLGPVLGHRQRPRGRRAAAPGVDRLEPRLHARWHEPCR